MDCFGQSLYNKNMGKGMFLIAIVILGFGILASYVPVIHAQGTEASPPEGTNPPEIKSELPPSPVRDAILRLLQPEEIFRTLETYIRVPLPGTGVKEVEVDKGKVTELNQQINQETGVNIIKFFQFVGKVMVIIFEGAARLIRGFLAASPGV